MTPSLQGLENVLTDEQTQGGRWVPKTFTKPLRADFVSDGPRLRKFVALFCKTEKGEPLVLDEWQAWLVDRVLERYPDDWHVPELRGRLRYQQVVISVGRQNGKSELAQVFGFYGLMMHEAGPEMVSLASNADQANIIYKRVKFTIDNHPALKTRFKTTGTRGITRLDKPGTYKVKPAKADALQGIPVSMCLFDEVHLCPSDMWGAMLFGTAARADGLVVGLTTAGDETAELLKTLYEAGRESAAGNGSERFGFFCWEAEEGCELWDKEAWLDANPSIACGRIDLDAQQEKVRHLPEDQIRRFRLNQFTSSVSTWLPIHLWLASKGEPLKPQEDVVFAVDRTPHWEHAYISGAVKDGTQVHTGFIRDLRKPTTDWLLEVCEDLYAKHTPRTFVMDNKTLGDLADKLEARGIPVKRLNLGDVTNACTTAYSLISQGLVVHDGDTRLSQQMPFATKRNTGDTWRISRVDSKHFIDAVMAMVFAVWFANNDEDAGVQIF